MQLRAHHLLCSVLFEGKGYSETFTKNMTQIVEQLRSPECAFVLQKKQDIICTDCPNLQADGSCGLDAGIHDLDQTVLDFFGLTTEKSVNSKEVFHIIKEKITPEFFETCCGDCRWKKMGICSYEKYRENLNHFFEKR